jgi:hypothetical protein
MQSSIINFLRTSFLEKNSEIQNIELKKKIVSSESAPQELSNE